MSDLTAIRCVLCDVDGVLTDGTLPFTADGQVWKGFSVRDGHLLRAAIEAGLTVGVISGRASDATARRCGDLGLDPVHLGVGAKMPVYEQVLDTYNLQDAQVAFIGDDYPDLPVIRRCGWGVTVADAADGVKRQADWVSTRAGGRGAVAEILERLLRFQGRWRIASEAHG